MSKGFVKEVEKIVIRYKGFEPKPQKNEQYGEK